jgi:hypothetical protein
MAALTTPRLTPSKGALTVAGPFGMAASTTCYVGGVVCLNPSGNVTPGSTGASLICMGVLGNQPNALPAGSVANSGAANALYVEIQQGEFFLDNDPSNPVTAADIGHACFLLDDHTVSRFTPGSPARCIAGTVRNVNPTGTSEPVGVGVWVKLNTVEPFQGTGPYS